MSSRVSKPIKRGRQCITRIACEPCREKRAKCDGEKPCRRCKARNLDCHFPQRSWASKCSLRDEIASLCKQLNRRECVLDAISASYCSGEDVLSMLRDDRISYDDAYDKVQGRHVSGSEHVNTPMGPATKHNGEPCDCESCWSPSTTNNNAFLSTSGSPFSFMDHALSDDTMSQSSSISEQSPCDPLQQISTVQSIPWVSGDDVSSFDDMLDGMGDMPTTGVTRDCPIADPMLWFQITSSSALDQPFHSWQGLLGDTGGLSKTESAFPCMG